MTKVKSTAINTDKLLCLALVGIILSGVALYVYFLSASIVHVVIRKEISQDLALLHTEISQLETAYIEAQHRVSDEIASLDGYAPVVSKTFIDRSAGSLVLSDAAR